MKKIVKKLALNRETIRTLQESDLQLVAGGGWHVVPAGPPEIVHGKVVHVTAGCPVTGGCPCGSTLTDSYGQGGTGL
jgi:hypothetical protein